MFQSLADEARALNQPPPIPDLFRRPMTPAVAQPNDPPPQIDQPQQQPGPTGGGGGQQGGGSAAQMAQALLLYQMLQGGPGGFLSRLNPGAQGRQAFRGLGQQGASFAGLNDPSIAALFDRSSYFKPSKQAAGLMGGQDLGQFRQYYGRGFAGDRAGGQMGLTPEAYENALTFLRTMLGLPV